MTRVSVDGISVILIMAAVAAILASLSFGPSAHPVFELSRDALFSHDDAGAVARSILLGIRLPRTVVAAVTGGALSAAGVLSQGLFRNPLASPSVLGTEAGAALAGVLVFYFGGAWTHVYALPLAAWAGAFAITIGLLTIAQARGRFALAYLLLIGFALNTIASALTSLVLSLALADRDRSGALLRWLLGGFTAKGFEHALPLLPLTAFGLAIAGRIAKGLDLLALGEEVAASLGLALASFKRWSVLAIAILVGSAVALGGALPFVGLLVPHGTRLLVGPAHHRLLTFSVINGMTLTLLADLAARTLWAPTEVEVGALTALIGAPLFVGLLWRQVHAAQDGES